MSTGKTETNAGPAGYAGVKKLEWCMEVALMFNSQLSNVFVSASE
jgi:hypothetical protein